MIATTSLVSFVTFFLGFAIVTGILLGFVGLYLGICGFVFHKLLTSTMSRSNDQASTETPPNAESISFKADEDQVVLKGLFLPSSGDRAIVLVHGLGSNFQESDQQEIAWTYVEAGFNVLMFDLRAHGSSGGNRLGLGWDERRDVRAAVNLLLERKFKPGKIGLHGTSYGAATALLSAAVIPEVGVVVADSAFADVRDVMDGKIERATGVPASVIRLLRPGFSLVANLFYSLNFDAITPEGAVPSITPRPILFIHGSKDQIIPIENSWKLKEASRNPRNELWILEGFEHTEGVRKMAEPCELRVVSPLRETYLKKVTGFFDLSL